MNEGLNKKVDAEFQKQKDNVEWDNKQESHKYLASKFSEMLAENPIVVYTKHENFQAEDIGRKFNKVEEVRTDESGTGGNIEVIFNYDNYVAVRKNGCSASNLFEKGNDYYKITEESYQNILTMMNELIKISGYSEEEKTKMFQYIVDNFKGKILKSEDLKEIAK